MCHKCLFVSRGLALLFLAPRHQMEWGDQPHAPGALYPRGRHGTLFTVGWVSPSSRLEVRKISSPPGSDPRPSSPQSVAIPTELPGPHINRKPELKNYASICGETPYCLYVICCMFRPLLCYYQGASGSSIETGTKTRKSRVCQESKLAYAYTKIEKYKNIITFKQPAFCHNIDFFRNQNWIHGFFRWCFRLNLIVQFSHLTI